MPATGCLHGAVDQRRTTASFFASISTTSLLSVMFAYYHPVAGRRAILGLVAERDVRDDLPARGSTTVDECASPFNENTRSDAGS